MDDETVEALAVAQDSETSTDTVRAVIMAAGLHRLGGGLADLVIEYAMLVAEEKDRQELEGAVPEDPAGEPQDD